MMEIRNHLTIPDETKTIQKRMSRADVKLKEIEQELQHAQEKICYIKKRLTHMKNVCEKRKLIDSKEFDNSSAKSSFCAESSVQETYRSSTYEYGTSYDALSNEENCYEDIRNFYSYLSKTSSTKSIVADNASLAFSDDTFQTEKHIAENKKPSVTNITTKVFSDKNLNYENNNEEKISISTNESSSSSHNFDHLNDLEPQEIFKPFPPTSKSDKKSQLILKINTAHKKTSKLQIIKKSEKMKRKLSRTNFMVNKKSQSNKAFKYNRSMIKQRKLKLKKSRLDRLKFRNSVFSHLALKSRKKFKRRTLMNRKPKNFVLKSNTKDLEKIRIINKHDSTPNVVELYHNTATKHSTPSVESSKHCIESQNEVDHEDFEQNQNLMEFIQNEVVKADSMNLNIVNSPKEELHQLELKGQFYEAGMQDSFSSSTKNRKKKSPDEPPAEDHQHCQGNCRPRSLRSYCCELLPTVRNYQQPTISSKLKKVKKSDLETKINLGNVPFLNGTSITRSYNLGLNPQKARNLAKTKHQTSADAQHKPMIKTEKTFNSDNQSSLGTLNVNSNNVNTNSIIESKSLIYQNGVKEVDNATRKVEQSNETVKITQKESVIHNIKNLSEDVKLKKSKNSLSNYENFSCSGTVENTMRKISNRFDVLNKKYEYLQNQLLKTNDKKIKKQLTQVENELNEKEEEMHAIVGLYLEVVSLKRQMKMQHSSSLFYITTQCSTHSSTKMNSSTTTKLQNSHSLHIAEYRQRKNPINKKISPTTKVFTGLLRNIQSIQNQLNTT